MSASPGAKKSTKRVQKLRAARARDGLKEIRGVWVPVKNEAAIKVEIKKITESMK